MYSDRLSASKYRNARIHRTIHQHRKRKVPHISSPSHITHTTNTKTQCTPEPPNKLARCHRTSWRGATGSSFRNKKPKPMNM